MKEYRLTLRFDMDDAEDRAAAEFLRHLDEKQYGSRNRFAIAAIQERISRLNAVQDDDLLDRIRQIVHAELQSMPLAVSPPATTGTAPELTDAQKAENARQVLEDLDMFG